MSTLFGFLFPVFFWGNADIPLFLESRSNSSEAVSREEMSYGRKALLSLVSLKKIPEKNILPVIPKEETPLVFWIFDATADDFVWPIQLFEEKTKTVKIVPRIFSDEKSYLASLQEAISQGAPPDFALVPDEFFPELSGELVTPSFGFFSVRECDDFFFSFSCSAFSKTGEIFGLPLFVKSSAMILNSDLFRDDRIALGDRPAGNWDDFLENWEKFQVFQKDKVFFVLSPENAGEMMSGILVQSKKSISLKNLASALENLKKFATWEGEIATLKKDFGNGEIGIIWGDFDALKEWKLDSELQKNKLRKSALGALPLPQVDEKNPRNLGRTLAFVVPKGAKNPDLSWAALAFFAEEENLRAVQNRSGRRVAWKFFGPFDSEKEILKNAFSPLGKTGGLEFSSIFAENGAAFFAGTLSSEELATLLFPFLK